MSDDMPHYIRKDGVPVSYDAEYKEYIADQLSDEDTAMDTLYTMPRSEYANRYDAEEGALLLRDLFPDSVLTIHKGSDPYLDSHHLITPTTH